MLTLGEVSFEIKSDKLKKIAEIKNGIYHFKTYLAGSWYSSESWQEVKTPIDLSVFAKIPKLSEEATSGAINLVYERGRLAIREIPGEKRLEIYEKMVDLLEKFRADFIEALVVNNGKTKIAAEGEIDATIERLLRADLDLKKIYGDYIPGDWSRNTVGIEALVRREPLGIVLGIVPFNYPLFDAVNKIITATIIGNAILIKPSSLAPVPILMLAKAMELAGFPREAFCILTIPGKEMKNLVRDKRISSILLTGSTETGEAVLKDAGIKEFLFELGGGDVAIVLKDAELQSAAKKIATGITSFTGQRCDSIKFILAEETIYEDLKGYLLKELRESVKVGDPRDPNTSVGPLIEVKTVDEWETAIKDACERGGKIIFGGKRLGQNYIEPVLLEIDKDRAKETHFYKKEIFASAALLVKIGNIGEAIALTNGRRYGLDAAIFGGDIAVIRRLIRFLDVGAIYVNDVPKHGIGYFPFGGRKDSGIGTSGIGYSIKHVSAYKSIIYNFREEKVWRYFSR